MSKLSDLSSDSDVYMISSDEDSVFPNDSIAKWTNASNNELKDHYRMLYLNEQVEKLILHGLKEAENSLTKIKQKMDIIIDEEQEKKQKIDSQMKKKKPILTRFALPYFKINGFHPPLNSDTIELMKYSALLHPLFKKLWTPDELTNLEENVIENAVKLSIRPLEARINFLSEKYISNKKKNSEICELEQEISTIRKDPWAQLAKNKEKLDWLQISADMKEFRDPNECQRMWEYFQNPDINKRNFTEEEDAELKKIIKEHGARNWENIAKELETHRSPFQCFQRYQRCLLERERERNFFTEEEDKRLVKIVENVRIGNVVNWYKVAHLLGTQKSHHQCSERYKNALKPNVRKGQWVTEDDAMLLLCHAVLGPKWRTIRTFLCDRPHYVCKRRYKSALRPLLAAWKQKEAEKDKEFTNLDTDSSESQSDTTLEPCKRKPRHWFSIDSKQYTIDEAFEFAKYGVEKVCGKEIDVSTCKVFEDFAHGVKFTDLKEISKILYSEGKELRRNSLRPLMRPVYLDSQELQDSPVQESNNEENFTVAFVEKQVVDLLKPLIPSMFQLYLTGRLRYKKFPCLLSCLNQIFDVEDDYDDRHNRIAPLSKFIEDFIIPSDKLPLFPPNFSTMSAIMSFISLLPPDSSCDSVEKSTDVAPAISCGKEYLKSFHNYSKMKENKVQNENESCFPALGNISTSKEVNREWKLFQKRIFATFQWPILLSQLPLTEEQITLLVHDVKEKRRSYQGKSKKRKHKSSTDEDC